MQVEEQTPSSQECIVPLRQWMNARSLHSFYSCILSEFQDTALTWNDFLPVTGIASGKCLRLEVYLWPMTLIEQRGTGKVLARAPFPVSPLLEEGS